MMKKIFLYVMLSSCFLTLSSVSAQNATPSDSLYVYLKNGGLDVYPNKIIKHQEQTASQLTLTLPSDSVIVYSLTEIDHLGGAPGQFPQFTLFKFNNKYNENLYRDVFAKIGKQEITATVGAIGKSLTPSFQVSASNAQVYVGDVLQESKVSRHRFDHPVRYVVTNEGYREMVRVKTKDEIWSDPDPVEPIYKDIDLRVDMLSTNADSNYPDREGLDKLLDGDLRTFFHSTWGSGKHAKLPLDQYPYLEVALDEALDNFSFKYVTRGDNDGRNPEEFQISGSNDGERWTEIVTLTEKDRIPLYGRGKEYVSPNISCGDSCYKYLRFTQTKSAYKNYLALAEFSLRQCVGMSEGEAPHLIAPAEYNYLWQPYGRAYQVMINWLTDADTAKVPVVRILLKDNKVIENIDRENYLRADIVIDGGSVFPNLVDSVLIKGRGNTSWGRSPKKPYRLKFASSVKPFGLTKGKNWVLLANNQTESMLTNAIGMKVARMAETAGANDIIPVDLYINDEYRGSYNFTQHVGLHNNSIDIDETNAVFLELDSYYDEDYKFEDIAYVLPINIKEPDLKDIPDFATKDEIKKRVMQDFNAFTTAIATNEEVEKWLDPTMAARYLMVNELVHNTELKHPKSCFLYREDLLALHSRYVLGPVWDLDWAFGYETKTPNYKYCLSSPSFDYFHQGLATGKGGTFFNAVRNLESVKRAYYAVWKDFMDHHLQELQAYIDDYYAFARPSLELNRTKWSDGLGYEEVAARFKTWLTERAEHIYSNLEKYDLNKPLLIERGDVNTDGAITMADAVCVQNQLLNLPCESYDAAQADANADGEVTISDLVWIVGWAMQAELDASRHQALPHAEACAVPTAFTAALGTPSEMTVALDIAADRYTAVQFDVTVPEGVLLEDFRLPDTWTGFDTQFAEVAPGLYRVAIYSQCGAALPAGSSDLTLFLCVSRSVASAQCVVSLSGITWVTADGQDQRAVPKSVAFDLEATGIATVEGTAAVSGGKCLQVEALTEGTLPIYGIDGRLLQSVSLSVGKNQIALPAGVYIVNQRKVVIHP